MPESRARVEPSVEILAEEIEELAQSLDRRRDPVLLDPRDRRLGGAGAGRQAAWLTPWRRRASRRNSSGGHDSAEDML